MKVLVSLLALGLSFSSFAQTFKIQESTRLPDLDICQTNHQRIINKFSVAADSQIARLLSGIKIETDSRIPNFKLDAYKSTLAGLLLKKIVYGELTKQLNAQKLSVFFSKKENYNKTILSTENIGSGLEAQIPGLLSSISKKNNLGFDDVELKEISSYLLKKSIKGVALSQARTLGSNIITGIVTIQGGKLILKSFTMSLGTKILTSAGTAIVLDLLTMPLKGSRLPPETMWTDLLNEYPSLIIMPDMMRQGGIHDHAWMTHCNAIQRRTKSMEKYLKEALQIDEAGFKSKVTSIYEMDNELPKVKKTLTFDYEPKPMPQDNTYVKPTVRIHEFKGPFWLYKLI